MIPVEPLTGQEARLVLEHLDNGKAAVELSDDDYKLFWSSKFKLLSIEVAAEFEERMPA